MLQVQEFFDKATSTLTYVVWDTQSKDAVVIDPVLDYDPASSKTSTNSLQPIFNTFAISPSRFISFWKPTPMPITFRARSP